MEIQKILSHMAKSGCEYAVLEVTSHGLDQGRVHGVKFKIAVLTNLTHEHLDYHKTFKNYVTAKSELFKASKFSLINEKYANKIRKIIGRTSKVAYYTEETLKGNLRDQVRSRFPESYNQLNATAAILAAKKVGIKNETIVKAIKSFKPVEGRMQKVRNRKGIKIIVDFAHTPNALRNVLNTLRATTPPGNKLIAVFGCAGERDTKKRPMMGQISTNIADISVFTAEDPRSESVDEIIKQMIGGIKNKAARYCKIPNRKSAIGFAIKRLAKKGDTVVICGKGHEKSLAIGGKEYPWSDVKTVRSLLI